MPSTPPTSSPRTRPSTTTPTPTTTAPTYPEDPVDPRWRFFTADRTRYTSAWFAGAHRVMIGFGCTIAPYYAHDPRCPGKQGFHHGIDVAMPCGTPLRSAVRGVVLDPSASGSPGAAYGERPFRIRTADRDVLIGHARRIFVQPGDRRWTAEPFERAGHRQRPARQRGGRAALAAHAIDAGRRHPGQPGRELVAALGDRRSAVGEPSHREQGS